MTEKELAALCAAITPPDEAARAAAHAHWASLAKPLGGLGGLETTIEDAAALTGSAKLDISRRAVLVLCADNGVVAQGVSQTDSSVTRAVAENLAARRTSVCRCTSSTTGIPQTTAPALPPQSPTGSNGTAALQTSISMRASRICIGRARPCPGGSWMPPHTIIKRNRTNDRA